jgi:glutathione synthase/RimK-type ligase-like ATP-grasp enzyme
MKRHNDKDFRSNIELGGTGENFVADKNIIDLCEKVASILKLDYCGIDILRGNSGNAATNNGKAFGNNGNTRGNDSKAGANNSNACVNDSNIYVCEVNSNAFFAAAERCCNTNIAAAFARHILSQMSNK